MRGVAPSSESLPPMIDCPPDLQAASDKPSFFVHGGPVERVERRGEGRSQLRGVRTAPVAPAKRHSEA
jgi:hypothetical protein